MTKKPFHNIRNKSDIYRVNFKIILYKNRPIYKYKQKLKEKIKIINYKG